MDRAPRCGGRKTSLARGDFDQRGIGQLDDRRSHSPHAGSFVRRQLAGTSARPPISWKNWTQEVIWFNLLVVSLTPVLSLYGLLTTPSDARTVWFCAVYYVFNMLGALPRRIDSAVRASACDSFLIVQESRLVSEECLTSSFSRFDCALVARARVPPLMGTQSL